MAGREVGDVHAVDQDRPVRDLLEPGEHPQQRRLPAPRRADEDEELAVLDREADVVHRDDVVAEDLRDVVDLDRRHVPYRALSIVVLPTDQDQRGPQYGILVLTTQPSGA